LDNSSPLLSSEVRMTIELVNRFGKFFPDKSFKSLIKAYDNLLINGMSTGKSLSKQAFKLAFMQGSKGGMNFSGDEYDQIFDYLDTNNNGMLEPDEFIAGVRVSVPFCSEASSRMLSLFYRSKNNYVPFFEIYLRVSSTKDGNRS
jgi:hypothetical protein